MVTRIVITAGSWRNSNWFLVLQPDMVFNIYIPLFLAPFGGFRFENGFLVTKEGNEKLTGWGKNLLIMVQLFRGKSVKDRNFV